MLLLLLSVVLRNYQLAGIGVAILVFLTINSLLLGGIKVKLSRVCSSERITEDEDDKIELQLVNLARRKRLFELQDKLPREFEVTDGNNYLVFISAPHKKTLFHYSIRTPIRGFYQVGPAYLRTRDPFGLFLKAKQLNIISTIFVYPKVYPIKEVYVKSRTLKMYPGVMPVKRPGLGLEFFSVREYIKGDPLKNINWKAYARTRKLMVNEHEWEVISEITIILDAREISEIGLASNNSLLHSARASATLTSYFLRRRDSVGLVVYGEKIKIIEPDFGDRQLYEILTNLAGVKASGNMPLQAVVKTILPRLSSRSPIILVSCLDADETIEDSVNYICAQNFDLTILSPSIYEFELEVGLSKAAYEILKFKREMLISKLRTYGAKVIDWDTKTPLLQALMEMKYLAVG